MSINCEFLMTNCHGIDQHYTCKVTNNHIIEDEDFLYIGTHEQQFSYHDVTAVWFFDCKMTKIPQKLTQIFPNLQALCVENSNLKSLSRLDLAEYKNITCFYSYCNPIEFLPGDLFLDLKNIEKIYFLMNNLTFIEPSILNGLEKLKVVNFNCNPNYDKCYSRDSTTAIEDVKNYLLEKFYARFNFLQNQVPPNQNQHLLNALENEKTKNSELAYMLEKGIVADIKNLYQNENFKDFKIIIDDREFPVHKFLITARSPTLAELLQNNPEAENANLTGISAEIFELILKFIYTDEFPRGDEINFLHLFITASGLGIKEVKNFAAVKVFDKINSDNALHILRLSNKYKHNGLREKAFEEIKKKYPCIEFDDEWSEDDERVGNIIESFNFGVEKIEDAIEEFCNIEI